jgi:exodeoxyribonuclease VIII
MALRVKYNQEAGSLLRDCLIEQSIYFTHEKTGIQCKARPDAMAGGLVIDLKTTVDASMRAFQGSAVRYGYFLQAAIINEALKSINQPMEHFVFIPVEKIKPYCVAVYMADGESIEHGIKQFDELMIGLAKCLESNVWPGYGVRDLELPKYALFDEILEIE